MVTAAASAELTPTVCAVVLCSAKVAPHLTASQVVATINALEVETRKRRPEVRWQFMEPDDRA